MHMPMHLHLYVLDETICTCTLCFRGILRLRDIYKDSETISTRVSEANEDSNVVVALLFYVHGKHLRSCRDGQLT